MLRVFVLCGLAGFGGVLPAAAGPWLRAEDSGFLSSTYTYRRFEDLQEQELALYGEYGLTSWLTVGADLYGRQFVGAPVDSGHGLAFARLALPSAGGIKSAVQLGVGGYSVEGEIGKMARMTLSTGRGFDSVLGGGWWSLDAAAEYREGLPKVVWKLDSTLGFDPSWKLKPILQFETTLPPGRDLIYSVLPGVRLQMRNNRSLLASFEYRDAGVQTLGFRAGLWQDF